MTVHDLFVVIRSGLGGVFVVFGLICMLGGVLGLLRFPDFYTRLHAARVSDALGAALFLIGLATVAGDAVLAPRLLLLAALVAMMGPTMSHLSASAAHAGGLAPLSGRFTAPRPGVKPSGAGE